MNEARATRYQRLKRRAQVAGVVSAGLVLAGLALTPASAVLASAMRGAVAPLPAGFRQVATGVGFIGTVVALCGLALLPVRLYAARRVEARYYPSESSATSATSLLRRLAGSVLTLLLLVPVLSGAAVVVLLPARWAGALWWVVAGMLLGAVLFAAVRLAPWFISHVFGTRSLEPSDLARRIGELAERSGVAVAGLHQIAAEAAPRATAFVAGIGRTRRVFISSEIVAHWQPDEIAVVVAHELGHHARQDLWRTLALDAVTVTLALGVADRVVALFGPGLALSGTADLAALPLVALAAGSVWLAATPVRHAQSRRQERRADEFALTLTGSAAAFSRAIRRLSARHLAEDRPSIVARWLFHRHPPATERLAFVERFQAADGRAERPSHGSRGEAPEC